MNEQVEFLTMSDREKHLFNLQGFLIVREFPAPEEINAFDEALDANPDIRSEFGPRGPQGKPFSGGSIQPIFVLGRYNSLGAAVVPSVP